MSDLTDFLLARIAEDEAVARAATPGPWWNESGTVHAPLPFGRHDGKPGPACHPLNAQNSNGRDAYADGEHAARHDPAHVLAECEAKRRVVKIHGNEILGLCQEDGGVFPCRTLEAMLVVYSDHPEWRP